jgi:hypothetical protein
MSINWNQCFKLDARFEINDGTDTVYVGSVQVGRLGWRKVAELYRKDYDHNGGEPGTTNIRIINLRSGEVNRFTV